MSFRPYNPYKSEKKKKNSECRRVSDGSLSRLGSLSSTGSSTNYPSSSSESPQVANAFSHQDSLNNSEEKFNAESHKKLETKSISQQDEDIQELFRGIPPDEFKNPLGSTQQEDESTELKEKSSARTANAASKENVEAVVIDLTKSQNDGEISRSENSQSYQNRSVEDTHEQYCAGLPDKENEISPTSPTIKASAYARRNTKDTESPISNNENDTKDSSIPHFFRPRKKSFSGTKSTMNSKEPTKKRDRSTEDTPGKNQGIKQRKPSECLTTKPVSEVAPDATVVPKNDPNACNRAGQQKRSSVYESSAGQVAKTCHNAFPEEQKEIGGTRHQEADVCYQPSSDEEDDEDQTERKPPALTQQFHQMTQEEHNDFVHQFTQKIRDYNDERVRRSEEEKSWKAKHQEDDGDDEPIDLDLKDEDLSKLKVFSQLDEDVELATKEESFESSQSETVYRYKPPITERKFGKEIVYKVGETWFHQPTPEHKIDPDTVYTIKGFCTTGTILKKAKCSVSMRMNKTFLGEELRDCWVEQEGGPVMVPLRKLTQYYRGFSKPQYLWSDNDGKTKGSEGYGFTYRHRVDGGYTKKELFKEPVVIELYAGVGGMSRGLENAGFNVSYLVEHDSNTARTLQGNFPGKRVFEESVGIFSKKAERKAPCYPNSCEHQHASTPCNGFSDANRALNGGKNGLRNNCEVRTFVDSVACSNPVTVSFENVTGILKDKHMSFLQEAVATLFLQLEYNVRVCVLNASDYGDAQNRRRVFLLASQRHIELPKEPVKTHGEAPNLLKRKTIGDCIGDLENITPETGCGYVMLADESEVCNHSSEGTDLKNEATRIVLKEDDAAPTLYNQSTNAMAHYSCARALTIREMARLQSFPDSHQLPSSRNKARRQIYNAVPVGLATAVAKSIMESCYDRKYPHGDI